MLSGAGNKPSVTAGSSLGNYDKPKNVSTTKYESKYESKISKDGPGGYTKREESYSSANRSKSPLTNGTSSYKQEVSIYTF